MLRIHRGLYAQLEGNEQYVRGRTQIGPVGNEITPEEVFANGPFGDVAHVREHVARYAELGVDQLSLYFDFGRRQHQVLDTMTLFAREVMPAFHGSVRRP